MPSEGALVLLRLTLSWWYPSSRLGDVEHLRGLLPGPGIEPEPGRLYWLTDRLGVILKYFSASFLFLGPRMRACRWRLVLSGSSSGSSLPRWEKSQVSASSSSLFDLKLQKRSPRRHLVPGVSLVRRPLHPQPSGCEAGPCDHEDRPWQQVQRGGGRDRWRWIFICDERFEGFRSEQNQNESVESSRSRQNWHHRKSPNSETVNSEKWMSRIMRDIHQKRWTGTVTMCEADILLWLRFFECPKYKDHSLIHFRVLFLHILYLISSSKFAS